MEAKKLGFKGEKIIAHYLQSKGYQILENNFAIRGGEIDLIARDKNTVVFVEVKTRLKDSFGSGEESFDTLKKYRLQRAIDRYIDKKMDGRDIDYRVDFIELNLDLQTKALRTINHFKDIEL